MHSLYLTRDEELLATIDLRDHLKADAGSTIQYLKDKGMNIVLLSGDRLSKTRQVAEELGVEQYYAEQLPDQKLEVVEKLSAQLPTAMVGDGINDAPALAKATSGVSLSNASQAAIQSAQIILLNGNLQRRRMPYQARPLCKPSKETLFWAFASQRGGHSHRRFRLPQPHVGPLFMAFFGCGGDWEFD
ncbi:MAG: cation-translocating P-type ATPase [Saprospirales bacterium]|nr:cation-translocating P-type ATPase [Saprospirales bacterium]